MHLLWSLRESLFLILFSRPHSWAWILLGGFAMLAAAMIACSRHGLGMHSGGSPRQGGSCQTPAALVSFGQNLPPPGPKLAIFVLSCACPELWYWGGSPSHPFFKKVFSGLSWDSRPWPSGALQPLWRDMLVALPLSPPARVGQPCVIFPCILKWKDRRGPSFQQKHGI